ncbi:MAG: MFS transporter [Rhizobiaceae bacterium]
MIEEEDIHKSKVSKKGIWGWMFFDWAAQPFHTLIITFIFGPYFAAFVAPNAAAGQTSWGYATAIAGIIIAVMSPILGAVADATGPRKPWIFAFSIVAVVGVFSLWWAVPNSMDGASVTFVLGAFILATIGYEFTAVFNNAMMPDLVPRSLLGRLSGNAWALGYVAGLLTLIIVLFTMATNKEGFTLLGIPPMFGIDAAAKEGERAVGPLSAIWYIIFIIPLFLFTPDVRRRKKVSGAVAQGLSDLATTIKRLPQNRSLFAYLGSSMIYRDALNGLYAFGGIYAIGMLGWSIVDVGKFGILAALAGVFGAYFGGRLDAKFGPKFVVTTSVIILIITTFVMISIDQTHALFMPVDSGIADKLFYLCGCVIGATGGAIQAASRTLMVDQAEPGRMTEAFGLYALSGRATAFLAPFLVALFTDISDSQRIGMLPIVLLFVVALFFLPMVKEQYCGSENAPDEFAG